MRVRILRHSARLRAVAAMSSVMGAALQGVDGVAIEVEVRLSTHLPRVDIVGLPEASVRESGARVRAAIATIGRPFPQGRVTINLAPAALRKGGAGLDLAIAIGILAAEGDIEPAALKGRGWIGELALDGRLRPVRGALALTLALRDAGCREVVVAADCARSAALAPGVEVAAASDLEAVLAHLGGVEPLPVATPPEQRCAPPSAPCLSEVRGQERAKRALEIAAAGGHGLLLHGPPGSGKTMLARRLPGLLPPLDFDECLAATRIHDAAGLLSIEEAVLRQRPFRAPHHTASSAGLLGGGSPPRPGEVSLAHCGVLFLDELPEFDRRCLEALRQVLEEGHIKLSRANFRAVFPADFMLIAAANPCPCGWYKSGMRDCRCDLPTVERYRRRISGPLLDRLDLHLHVPAVPWADLSASGSGETSHDVRQRAMTARSLQAARGVACNARIPDRQLDALVDASAEARELLGRAVDRLKLSARAARRVLRIARTVADLAGETPVQRPAMAEALGYRAEHEIE